MTFLAIYAKFRSRVSPAIGKIRLDAKGIVGRCVHLRASSKFAVFRLFAGIRSEAKKDTGLRIARMAEFFSFRAIVERMQVLRAPSRLRRCSGSCWMDTEQNA